MGALFSRASAMMLGGFVMMLGGLFVMLGGFGVMLRKFGRISHLLNSFSFRPYNKATVEYKMRFLPIL
jgi:hypothetical protein